MHIIHHRVRRCINNLENLVAGDAWMLPLEKSSEYSFSLRSWQQHARHRLMDLYTISPWDPEWRVMFTLAVQEVRNAPDVHFADLMVNDAMVDRYIQWEMHTMSIFATLKQYVCNNEI